MPTNEVVELVLECGHPKRVVSPTPLSLYLCHRCNVYGHMKYAVPA